jgi:arylsulfatase A-like enzyme
MLWASFVKPHPPFETPTPWNKVYRTKHMPGAFVPPTSADLINYWNRNQNRYKYRDHGIDELLVRTLRCAYFSCVTHIDHHVGRILAALGDEIDNTLIVYSSDHGELLGDYNSFGKRCMLDAGARVPMLVRWPGHFEAGGRCAVPTTLLDVFPTFCAAGGADPAPPHADGRDLAEVAAGRAGRDTVFSQLDHAERGLYMATTERWKYFYSAADRREWLLDLTAEPREQTDLATDPAHAEPLADMRARCVERFRRDGFDEAIDGDGWREQSPAREWQDPDEGLLIQDPRWIDDRVASLGLDD